MKQGQDSAPADPLAPVADASPQRSDSRMLADVITPEFALANPHLKNLSGNIIMGNDLYQVVVAGASPGVERLSWTPLILAIFLRTGDSWVASSCLTALDVRRNWTDHPLPTQVLAVIPSLTHDDHMAKLDVIYQIAPGGTPKKEFFRMYLREHDPRLYLMTDHVQFEKQRPQLEGRIAFRARIKSDDFFQTAATGADHLDAFSFECKNSLMGVIGSAPFKAKYFADNQFEFQSPGRNGQGWEGFMLFFGDDLAQSLHLTRMQLKHCAPASKDDAESSLVAIGDCQLPQTFPKLVIHRPPDDLAHPRRCLKLQNALRQEVARPCFRQGLSSLTVPLVADASYFLYDMLTGQIWGGGSPPLKLKNGETQEIHLPSAPPPKEGT